MRHLLEFFPSRTVAFYMSRLFLVRTLSILGAIVLVLQALDLLSESGNILAVAGNGQAQILTYVGLRMPQIVAFVLPFSVLLGTILTLIRTQTGRLWRTLSLDDGANVQPAASTAITSSDSPAMLLKLTHPSWAQSGVNIPPILMMWFTHWCWCLHCVLWFWRLILPVDTKIDHFISRFSQH